MRKSILLLLLGLGACEASDGEAPVLIEGFDRRAVPLTCEAADLGVAAAPVEIRLASDTTWTLLDAAQRQILVVSDGLQLVSRTRIPAAGPGAAPQPVSVAALGDTAFAVAARGALRVVTLSRSGEELASTPLDFIPHSIEATREGALVVAPVPLGDRPPTLLMRLRDDRWEPLPVPRRPYADMVVGALGNSLLVEELPDATLLAVHQFLKPRAYRVHSSAIVETLVPPIPDATASNLDFVPRAPITPDQMPRTLLPAMALSVDPRSSEVYLLTRSGAERAGRLERAVLRLDQRVELIEAYTVPVHAVAMVMLPRRKALLLLDDEDRFHVCDLPGRGPAGDTAE